MNDYETGYSRGWMHATELSRPKVRELEEKIVKLEAELRKKRNES